MSARVKRFVFISTFVLVTVTALVLVRSYLFDELREEIERRLQALNKTDLNIQYDSIIIDWRKNLIIIDRISIQKDAYDTTCIYPEFISARQVRAGGFGLSSLIFRRTLSFESVHILEPHFVLREHSKLLPDSASKSESKFILNIDDTYLSNVSLEYTDSAGCNLITEARANIRASHLKMESISGKPLALSVSILQLDSTSLNLPREFYTLKIRGTKINFSKRALKLDTMKIIPHFSKTEFGRKAGREIDRLEGVVPLIELSGLSYQKKDSLFLKAGRANVQAFLKIFRDKRLIHKQIFKPLPVQQLRKLSFGLVIDTLEILKSYIEYEEFPEEGETSGTVFFDNLAGQIYNINNNPELSDGSTIVNVQADFMGDGKLKVHTIFPWKKAGKCLTEGTLENLNMVKINSVLLPMSNIVVESGNMEKLSFRFSYDATRSDGALEMNYSNLKLATFKDEDKLKKQENRKRRKNKDPDDVSKKDNLKSFILNTFVIRRNMNEKMSEEKRTGKVMFYRDTSRSIFNYWWKSLFSGIKSAHNLDKPTAKKKNRNKKNKSAD